jgi:hypothetical protein
MPYPYDNLWVSNGSSYVKPNIAYAWNGTSWRRVQKLYVSNGQTYELVAQYPSYSKIAQGITDAVANIEPHKTIFNELISGRRLGDIDNSGSVTALDALRATQFNSYALAAGAAKTYIEDVMTPTMMRNQAKYADYF